MILVVHMYFNTLLYCLITYSLFLVPSLSRVGLLHSLTLGYKVNSIVVGFFVLNMY